MLCPLSDVEFAVDKADFSNPQAASEAHRRTKANTAHIIITAMSEMGVVERKHHETGTLYSPDNQLCCGCLNSEEFACGEIHF